MKKVTINTEEGEESDSDFYKKLEADNEPTYNPSSRKNTKRLTQSASKLSNIRIKRVKSSQIAKRHYMKTMNESKKRMLELKNKKENELRLQKQQKNLQLKINR